MDYRAIQLIAFAKDADKFHVEAEWMGYYRVLCEAFVGLHVKVRSDQSHAIPRKPRATDAPGMKRVTFRKIPLGRLVWDERSNHRLCTEYRKYASPSVRMIEVVAYDRSFLAPLVYLYFEDEHDHGYATDNAFAYTQSVLVCMAIDHYEEHKEQLDTLVAAITRLFKPLRTFKCEATPLVVERNNDGAGPKTVFPLFFQSHTDGRSGGIKRQFEERRWVES